MCLFDRPIYYNCFITAGESDMLKKKQRTVDLHQMLLRHREEITILLKEMTSFVSWLSNKHRNHKERILRIEQGKMFYVKL